MSILILLIIHTTPTTGFLMFLRYAPVSRLFNILMLFSLISTWLTTSFPSGLSSSQRGLPQHANIAVIDFQLPTHFFISSTYHHLTHYIFCLFTLATVCPSLRSMRADIFICFLHCYIHKINSLAKSGH